MNQYWEKASAVLSHPTNLMALATAAVSTALVQLIAVKINEPYLVIYVVVGLAIFTLAQRLLLDADTNRAKMMLGRLIGTSRAFMVSTEEAPIILESGRKAEYAVYLSLVFRNQGGMILSKLAADYISASNLRADCIIGHHKVPATPKNHHEDYGLVPTIAQLLGKPYAVFHEKEDGVEIEPSPNVVLSGRALLLDDVTTGGGTLVDTAKWAREKFSSVMISDALVFLLRPSGNRRKRVIKRLQENKIELHYLITSEELLGQLFSEKFIDLRTLEQAKTDLDFSDEEPIRSS